MVFFGLLDFWLLSYLLRHTLTARGGMSAMWCFPGVVVISPSLSVSIRTSGAVSPPVLVLVWSAAPERSVTVTLSIPVPVSMSIRIHFCL